MFGETASQNLLLLGEDLTLRGQSGGSALTVNSSNVVVISLQVAPVTFDANGGVRAIWIDSGSSLGLDNTSTFGGTQEHIAVTDSRIYFNGGNVITANQISVAGGQLTLETGVSFESTQPSTFVSFNGMIADNTPVITTATCSTGGVAYRLTSNVCN